MGYKEKTIRIFVCDVCGKNQGGDGGDPINKHSFAVVEIEGAEYDFCVSCFVRTKSIFEFLIKTVGVSFEFELVGK